MRIQERLPRTINGKIILTIMGSLLIGILLLVTITSISAISYTNQTVDSSSDVFLQEELDNLNRLVDAKAQVVNEYFEEVISQLAFVRDFATELFNDRIDVVPRDSYYGNLDITLNQSIPPMIFSPKHQIQISTEYSAWWMTDIDSVENDLSSSDWELVDKSSNLDFAFKTIYAQNPLFLWNYMGFETGLHRTYPYKDLSSWQTQSFTICNSNGQQRTGYDPRIRQYYCDAKNAGEFVIPRPQIDPTLGILKISISVPVYYDNNSLVGAIGGDLTIDAIEATVSELKILDHGYAFIIDQDKYAIMHPDIDRSHSQFIEELEVSNNDRFEDILDNMIQLQTEQNHFIKDSKKWYISYAPILSTGFSLGLLVPEGDILEPAYHVRSDIYSQLGKQFLIFFIIIIITTLILLVFSNYSSKRIIEPIKELTEVTDLIAKGNLSKDLTGGSGGAREISLLYNIFGGLITALRFGNESYYAGNIDRALKNYHKAMTLFESLENEKGKGICYNNIGNIQRLRGNLKDANQYYKQSIEIGEKLLSISSDREETIELTYALSSRYNNLGLLYREIEEYDLAQDFIEKALELDKKIDNSRGFATRYGNLGLIYLDRGNPAKAKEYFDEAYEIALSTKSERSLCYAQMNYGIYERKIGNDNQAIDQFLKASETAHDLDVRVVTTSLTNIKEIYIEKGKTDEAKRIDSEIQRLVAKNRSKEVAFLLDYSGSMAGKRIKSAVKGMREIFKKQVNPSDIVSLIIFNNQSDVWVKPIEKEGNEKEFMLVLDRLTFPTGGTAFYDALGTALQDFINRPTSNEQWIIALTDGDDNSSTSFKIPKLLNMAEHSVGVHIVIIGIGELTEKAKLTQLCKLTDKGVYLNVKGGVDQAISSAFEEVSNLLAEIEVEGFVSDY